MKRLLFCHYCGKILGTIISERTDKYNTYCEKCSNYLMSLDNEEDDDD